MFEILECTQTYTFINKAWKYAITAPYTCAANMHTHARTHAIMVIVQT